MTTHIHAGLSADCSNDLAVLASKDRLIVAVVVKFFNKNFVRRKVDNYKHTI